MTEDAYELDTMRVGDDQADADAPLISDDLLGGHEEYIENRRKEPQNHAKTTLGNAGRVIWLLTFSAGISGLLFGYDTGVISSTLVSIGSDLSNRELTTTDKSLITAITSLFALVSAPTTGYFADKYGRRFVILLASLQFIAGALVQAAARQVWLMVVGRAAVGAAVGLSSCATPLYIAELAPAELRGRLVTIQSLFITGGQVVAYVMGWLLARLNGGWRWMVGLGAVPAILLVFLLTVMYETPRWLVKNGKRERARTVLQSVYGGLNERDRERTVDGVLVDIQTEIAAEVKLCAAEFGDSGSSLKKLATYPPYRRALIIACMLQTLQQFCGFNSLMYFSATIFQLVHFDNPIGVSLSVACTNFVFTLAAFAIIDSIGRRNILLSSIPFMVLGLGMSSVAFQFLDFLNPSPAAEVPPESTDLIQTDNATWPGVLVASIMFYVSAYAIGLGCVPWQQSELFPLQVRSFGSGIATATNWASNFIIGISFLPMMISLGPTTTFAAYAIICAGGGVVVFLLYPETAGLELEGVGALLKNGFGVRESVERFKARKNKTDWEPVPNEDNEDDGG